MSMIRVSFGSEAYGVYSAFFRPFRGCKGKWISYPGLTRPGLPCYRPFRGYGFMLRKLIRARLLSLQRDDQIPVGLAFIDQRRRNLAFVVPDDVAGLAPAHGRFSAGLDDFVLRLI